MSFHSSVSFFVLCCITQVIAETTQYQKGEACSSTDDCFGDMACLPGPGGTGVCCEFPHSEISIESDGYMRSGCASCGASDHEWQGDTRAGLCTSCSSGYTYLSGGSSTDPPWYDTMYYQYFAGLCVPDGFSCDLNTMYLGGMKMEGQSFWPECNQQRQSAGSTCQDSYGSSHPSGFACLSQKCLGGYCCAENTACASGMCDSGSGACSVKVGKGEACSSTDDCFGDMACLPGPGGTGVCCEFPHSEISIESDGYMRSGCASCGASDHEWQGDTRAGLCTSCSSGYTYLSGGSSTDPPWYDTMYYQYFAGLCVPDGFSCDLNTMYLGGMKMEGQSFWPECNQQRQSAGSTCQDSYGSSHPSGFACLSQKCLGGYCCAENTACASGMCDSGSGACSVKVGKGEACSSTDDCFGDMACLPGPGGTGVCCEFPHSEISIESDGYMRSGCASCGASDHEWQGDTRAGLCTSCSSGYTYLSGGSSTDPPWYDTMYYQYFAGLCVPDGFSCDLNTMYLGGMKMEGQSFWPECNQQRQSAGSTCQDSYGSSHPSGFACLSQKCLGGYCCAEDALLPLAGECCSLCAASTGECVSRSSTTWCSGSSSPAPCDASVAIENGVASPCTSSLTAGSSCEPTCNNGYTLTGSRSCDGGTLADTAACTIVDCASNQYWDGDSCEACPGGSTSAGGAVTSCTCTANQYIVSGACTACPAQSTSDDAGSTYCICDGGYYAKKTAGVWSCETCEGATASRIPQDDGEDDKCVSALKATAEASRDTLLGDIADESVKKKAKLLADAAIAGEKVRKITVKEEASDEASACSSAFTKADMQPSDGACVATAASSGRRRLSATTYDVELVFSSSTVSESKLSAAVNSLKANGVEVVKSESAVDPIAELENIPGVDSAKLTTFKTDADCGVRRRRLRPRGRPHPRRRCHRLHRHHHRLTWCSTTMTSGQCWTVRWRWRRRACARCCYWHS